MSRLLETTSRASLGRPSDRRLIFRFSFGDFRLLINVACVTILLLGIIIRDIIPEDKSVGVGYERMACLQFLALLLAIQKSTARASSKGLRFAVQSVRQMVDRLIRIPAFPASKYALNPGFLVPAFCRHVNILLFSTYEKRRVRNVREINYGYSEQMITVKLGTNTYVRLMNGSYCYYAAPE